MISIKDVAARADVSLGTVSNVLNRPDQVSPESLRRVHEAIAALGYVRNRSAAQLRAGRSAAVGLVLLDIANPFFASVALGVEQMAEEHGLSVLLCNADSDVSRQDRHLRFLEEQRVDGLLVTPVGRDLEPLAALRRRGTPVVLVDDPGSGAHCAVAVDDRAGGQAAAAHLLDAGRRRLVYVTGPRSIRQCVERGHGVAAAVKASTGATVRSVRVRSLDGAAGHAAVPAILGKQPDAVFCANDVVALGVLRGLLEAGVRVPDDVALVGYDDIEFATTAAVPLTSIRQPALEIGRTAMKLLLDERADGPAHEHQTVLFHPELVVRASSAGG